MSNEMRTKENEKYENGETPDQKIESREAPGCDVVGDDSNVDIGILRDDPLGMRCCRRKSVNDHEDGCIYVLFEAERYDLKPAKKAKCIRCKKFKSEMYTVEWEKNLICYFCVSLVETQDFNLEFVSKLADDKIAEIVNDVVAVHCDGGLIRMNSIGGTWAWCGVNEEGQRIVGDSGYVLETQNKKVTNNTTEQIAIVRAIEMMPDGWAGVVNSDSACALWHLTGRHFNSKLPGNVVRRCEEAVRRLGKFTTLLHQGHPTEDDLRRGIGERRNLPVSIHNVWCDWECERQRDKYYEDQEKIKTEIK